MLEHHPLVSGVISNESLKQTQIGNEEADTLAKHKPLTRDSTYSRLMHHARMRAQLLWRRQWAENSPKAGSFALADTVPPLIAPNAIFRSTPHELFGRVVQTLTGQGYTGEYYQRFKFVPTESPWCSCSDEVTDPILQTRQLRLPSYRNILRKNHPNLHVNNYSLHHLFDPRNGLPNLIQFIHRSGAFTKSGAPRPDPKPD